MTSAPHKDRDGNIRWYDEKGGFHRENGPAVEHTDGSKHWFVDGLRHRENGPAIERLDGRKEWWINGHRHREDGPAVEWGDGSKEWYLNGHHHRENGPAVEWGDGRVEYYLNDQKSPEIEQQVKENMTRIQAQKEQKELLILLSQDQDVSAKINTSFPKISKKL